MDNIAEDIYKRKMIGLHITAKMKELGISQSKLAELTGLVQHQVNYICNGNRNYTIDTLLKIERVLKIKIII